MTKKGACLGSPGALPAMESHADGGRRRGISRLDSVDAAYLLKNIAPRVTEIEITPVVNASGGQL